MNTKPVPETVRVALFVLLANLAGCSFVPLIPEEKDRGPERPVSVDHIGEPVPQVEPRTIAGNRSPYKVLGKTYTVLPNPDGYREKGVASWYGKKFHGRRTSNGEIYDMYAMTAAHKTLPIPSYVKVTNLKNKRSIIVRVNDRGPFHGNRLIDLSYTAAKKLGFENIGTADVLIEYIDPLNWSSGTKKAPAPAPPSPTPKVASLVQEPPAPVPSRVGGYQLPPNTWLQVGAFGQHESAERMKKLLETLTRYPVVVVVPGAPQLSDKLYRVRIGPIQDNFDILEIRRAMQEKQLPDPHVVYVD